MADYVVKFSGQDNLSSTIKNIKNELNSTGQTATKLDQIRDKFNRISNSSAPLKKQLRDIQALMAQMNLNGLSGSEEFAVAAARAGQLKDAIADAAQATRLLSSDTAGLDAGIQALQGLAGAAGVATGVMGLLGVENEKTQQAMLKVQSVLSVMNGIQQVANVLNKDSILMLKLKQIAQSANAAASTKAAVAEGVHTTAIVANTVATKAWNVVTAIAKALLGDWSGLILVGAGALATYAIATSDSKSKQEQLNKTVDSSKKIFQDYTSAVATNAGQLVGKYQQLKAEWQSLKTTGEKTKWIKDNASEFKNLGLKVNDLTSAENTFIGNTNKVVAALEARARVMAAQSQLTEAYSNYYKQVLNADSTVAGGGYYKPVKVGDTYSSTEARGAGTYDSSRSGYSNLRVQSQQEADQINAYRQQKARETNQKIKNDATASLNKTVSQATKIIEDGNKQIQGLGITPITTGGGGSRSTGGRSTGGGTTVQPIPEGSLADIKKQLSEKEKQLQLTPVVDTEKIAELKKQIAELKEKELDAEVILGIKVRFADSKVDADDLKPKQLTGLNLDFKEAIEPPKIPQLKQIEKDTKAIQDAAMQAGQAFSQLGNAIGGTAGAAIDLAGMMAQAIVTMIQGYATASAQSASLGPWAWIAFAATGLAQLAAMISAVKSLGSYADGGVIGGNSYHGDSLLANVNAGEMILNQKQQANLFRALNNGVNSGGGQVEFKISGSALKGVLKNYDSKMSKVR